MSNASLAPLQRHAFKPGQSGNPGGKPKYPSEIKDIRAAARTWSVKAIETLGKALTAGKCPWSVRVSAASVLLDRGYGKPHQTIDVHALIGSLDLSRFSPDELDALEALVTRAAQAAVIDAVALDKLPVSAEGPAVEADDTPALPEDASSGE